jgi:type I restriction enzyme S subunit
MTTTCKFSDWVASYRNGYGKRPAAGESGPIVLRIADVSSGLIDLTNPRRGIVPDREAKTYRLQQGDLIFVRVNGAREIVGRCCVVGPEVPADTIFNDHLIRVRLVPEVDPEFARLCVSVQAAREVIEEAASTSAGQLSISQQVLDSIDVPDLPYKRQCEIAARVRAQLDEVEAARHAARAQLREVGNLANAIVLDSVRSHRARRQLLGDVLEEVKHGIGRRWADFPVLGATRDGLAPAKEQPGKHAPKYKPAFPGTVFYNPMRILIGSIAFVDEDDAPGITSPDYVALQGRPGKVESRWFYQWLRSPLGADCIASLARGAVRERMLFNRLAEGQVDLPDFAVQEKASQALKELKPLRCAIVNKLAAIDLLPQKILAQAFEK